MNELKKYLEQLSASGSPPGAVQALSKIAALAAAVSRSSDLDHISEVEIMKASKRALRAGELDEEAYWDERKRADGKWIRETPGKAATQIMDLAKYSSPHAAENPIDAAVARMISLAAAASCRAIANHNDPTDSSSKSISAACNRNLKLIDVSSSDGCTVRDTSGVEYLDGSSGLWNCPLGHGHPAPLSGFLQQAIQVSALNPFTQSCPTLRVAAEKILGICKLEEGGVFFCSSGSEAVETALRFALSLQGSNAPIFALPGSFHGATLGASMLSAYDSLWREYRQIERITVHTEVKNWEAEGIGVFEPVKIGGGVQRFSDVAALQRFRASGGIAIADEIACGLGRTYWPLASLELGISYDMVLLGKGLANGIVPVSCVAVSKKVRLHLEDAGVDFGHTHSNHLASAGAAIETLRELEVIDHEEWQLIFRDAVSSLSVPALVEGATAAVLFGNSFPRKLVEAACYRARILVHLPTVAKSVDRIVFAPPLLAKPSELAEMIGRIQSVVAELQGDS